VKKLTGCQQKEDIIACLCPCICLLLTKRNNNCIKKNNDKKKRYIWMKKWIRKWNLFGASNALIRELTCEDNVTYTDS
jgi:hypothetical protein